MYYYISMFSTILYVKYPDLKLNHYLLHQVYVQGVVSELYTFWNEKDKTILRAFSFCRVI